MELGLQFEDILCWEESASVTCTREEAMETVIPEYCPAVARVIETTGKLCIREKLVGEDLCTFSGSVKVTVLYTSEEVAGLRSLTVNVPFSCPLEDRTLAKYRTLWVTGRLLMAETSVVTSRKLYIKVMPEITVTPYREGTRRLCCGTEAEPTVRRRAASLSLPILSAVTEKECSVTCQSMNITGAVPEDMLCYHVVPSVLSHQRVGNQLMVKGELWLCTVYRSEDRTLHRWEEALDFSQIVNVAELPDDADYLVTPQLRESDVRILRSDGGTAFGITARMVFGICVYRRCNMECVADLYSTRCHAALERRSVSVPVRMPPRTIREEAQLQLEFDTPPAFVCLTDWDCGAVTATAEEHGQMLRSTVHLHILYLDETGAPVSTSRSVEVSAATGDVSGGVTVQCGRPVIQNAGSTVRMSVPVIFTVGVSNEEELSVITAVTLTEEERGRTPSLILRRMASGETLWDIAKQYRTDEEAIRSANHLEDGAVPSGLLLIPKLR